MSRALIVHGGAWNMPDDQVEPARQGCIDAARAGWEVLTRGASALDAVRAAVVLLEDDPVFDAGARSITTAMDRWSWTPPLRMGEC